MKLNLFPVSIFSMVVVLSPPLFSGENQACQSLLESSAPRFYTPFAFPKRGAFAKEVSVVKPNGQRTKGLLVGRVNHEVGNKITKKHISELIEDYLGISLSTKENLHLFLKSKKALTPQESNYLLELFEKKGKGRREVGLAFEHVSLLKRVTSAEVASLKLIVAQSDHDSAKLFATQYLASEFQHLSHRHYDHYFILNDERSFEVVAQAIGFTNFLQVDNGPYTPSAEISTDNKYWVDEFNSTFFERGLRFTATIDRGDIIIHTYKLNDLRNNYILSTFSVQYK